MTCTLQAAHLYFVAFKASEKFNKEIFVYTQKNSLLIIKLVMYTVQHLLQLLVNKC